MFDPSGPLPPSVYWRRRAGAVVAAIVAVILLAWIIGGLIGDDGPGDPSLAGMLATRTPVPPSSPPSVTRYTRTSGSTTTKPAVTTTSKPQPPLKCADAAVAVTAKVGAQRYRVGERPVLTIVIGNRGQLACTRDISRKLRELTVVTGDGVTRLWSSNDCVSQDPDKDVRLLQPGQTVAFSITWAGRTSAHGCPADRTTVQPGRYFVVAKLGKLVSRPTPLRLTG